MAIKINRIKTKILRRCVICILDNLHYTMSCSPPTPKGRKSVAGWL